MCKTRFGSQGMILNGFKQKFFLEKKLNGTRDPPSPFKANSIKIFHFVFLILSLANRNCNQSLPVMLCSLRLMNFKLEDSCHLFLSFDVTRVCLTETF